MHKFVPAFAAVLAIAATQANAQQSTATSPGCTAQAAGGASLPALGQPAGGASLPARGQPAGAAPC